MRASPTHPGCPRGPLLVTLAALIFAGANAAATGIYRRGGTIVTVFLLRCMVVYLFNGLIVAHREGRDAARRVLLLRTGRRRSFLMAIARSLTGAFMGVLLNLSFVMLTFADAFTIFKGTDTIATIVLSRALLGSTETLSASELGCGLVTVLGITLIAQPPLLFGSAGGAAAGAAGVAVAITAGCGSGGFNFFTRALSRKGGAHEGHLPPAMLLSCFMVPPRPARCQCHCATSIAVRTRTRPNPEHRSSYSATWQSSRCLHVSRVWPTQRGGSGRDLSCQPPGAIGRCWSSTAQVSSNGLTTAPTAQVHDDLTQRFDSHS